MLSLALLGGLLNRWRGGLGPGPGHGLRRMVLAALTGAWVSLFLGASWWAAPFVLLTWAGLLTGWGSYMDLGRMPAPDNERLAPVLDLIFPSRASTFVRDFVGLALRGLLLTAPAAVPLFFWGGPWYYALAGAAMAPIYALAWVVPSKIKGFHRGPELAEFLFGCYLWAMLTL